MASAKVLVLGCGPAGLIAAERCEREGASVTVAAQKSKSVMPGAQYLHSSIPGITPQEAHGYLCVKKRGDGHGYATKVYGDPDAPVSWDKYEEGYVPAWHLGQAYDKLWLKWEERIRNFSFNLDRAQRAAPDYDLILSTIPAPAMCQGGCLFDFATVHFSQGAVLGTPDDTIVYNGDLDFRWYRTSRIFGHESTEWARRPNPSEVHTVEARKPTASECTCKKPGNLVKLGRFGAWDKNFLVHHAWEAAHDALLKV